MDAPPRSLDYPRAPLVRRIKKCCKHLIARILHLSKAGVEYVLRQVRMRSPFASRTQSTFGAAPAASAQADTSEVDEEAFDVSRWVADRFAAAIEVAEQEAYVSEWLSGVFAAAIEAAEQEAYVSEWLSGVFAAAIEAAEQEEMCEEMSSAAGEGTTMRRRTRGRGKKNKNAAATTSSAVEGEEKKAKKHRNRSKGTKGATKDTSAKENSADNTMTAEERADFNKHRRGRRGGQKTCVQREKAIALGVPAHKAHWRQNRDKLAAEHIGASATAADGGGGMSMPTSGSSQ